MSGGAPPGWVDLRTARGFARFDAAWAERLVAAGLTEPQRFLGERPPGPGTGRGPRARVRLEDGTELFVKQALRGGWLARFNRERYLTPRRFLRDIELAATAQAAGAPVVRWLGVVCERARPGWRAFLVAPYVSGAEDLARRLSAIRDAHEARALWRAALEAVGATLRCGLFHRDLNLGNLLARPRAAGWEVLVVDLDRVRLFGGPVPPRLAGRVRARLRRSWDRILGPSAALSPAARDEEIARALGGRTRTAAEARDRS